MRNKFLIIIVISMLFICLTGCKKSDEGKNLVCTKEDNESYQYEELLGTTYIIRGMFSKSGKINNYYMQVIMMYNKNIDDKTFDEYILENEENVSMFDTSNNRIKYQTGVDKTNKTISYSMQVSNIDEEFGKSGEVFSSSMYTLKGFKESLEKSGYKCK